jgi:amidase
VDDEVARATRGVADVLEALGHHVEQETPPWPTILTAAAGPMAVPGPAALIAPEEYHLVEPRNRPILEADARLTVLEHSRWVDLVRDSSRQFLPFWERFDVLLTPTAGIVAPSVDWAPWDQTPEEHMNTFMTFPNFAQPFNLSGQPAFSLPLAWSTTGLPIGMQLAARPFGEVTLVRLAAQLEAVRPWADRHPPL